MQKIEVFNLCDLDTEEVTATDVISFGFDGSEYVLDACEEHALTIRNQLGVFVENSRRVTRRLNGHHNGRPGTPRPPHGKDTAEYQERQAIRQWARDRGEHISERGRIPEAIIAEYHAAKDSAAQQPSEPPARGRRPARQVTARRLSAAPTASAANGSAPGRKRRTTARA